MCGFFFSFFACTPHSCCNAAESERCGIAFVEVLQHSYSEPGVYNLLASHRMILEGHCHTVFSPLSLSNIQARVRHVCPVDISSDGQGLFKNARDAKTILFSLLEIRRWITLNLFVNI